MIASDIEGAEMSFRHELECFEKMVLKVNC